MIEDVNVIKVKQDFYPVYKLIFNGCETEIVRDLEEVAYLIAIRGKHQIVSQPQGHKGCVSLNNFEIRDLQTMIGTILQTSKSPQFLLN